MMEDRQNTPLDGSGDDLLSDIPAAVVAGNEEHAAPPAGTDSPSPPNRSRKNPRRRKKSPAKPRPIPPS